MTQSGRNSGFSLLELMIVVAIIGILSSVAIPFFLGMQDRSRKIALRAAVESSRTEISNWMNAVQSNETGTVDFNCDGVIDAQDEQRSFRPRRLGQLARRWDDIHALGAACEARSPYSNEAPLFSRAGRRGSGQIRIRCWNDLGTCWIRGYSDDRADGTLTEYWLTAQ